LGEVNDTGRRRRKSKNLHDKENKKHTISARLRGKKKRSSHKLLKVYQGDQKHCYIGNADV